MSVILYTETKHLKIITSPAKEEDEVPYYTGRKDLADIEDATVDTEDNEKTLIKRYVFLFCHGFTDHCKEQGRSC